MRRNLLRIPNFFACNFLHSPVNVRNSKAGPWFVPVGGASIGSRLVFFSSDSDSSRGSERARAPDSRSSRDDEDVSNEELKRRIKRFLDDGDKEAIPAIFEAILKRKLSGKHDESDSELMEEFGEKHPVDDQNMGGDDDWNDEIDGPKDEHGSESD